VLEKGDTECSGQIGTVLRSAPSCRRRTKKKAVECAIYDVRNKELVEAGLYKVEVRNHLEEIVSNFFVD